MKIYIVHGTVGGFARGDSEQSRVVCATADETRAKQVKLWWHDGAITEIEIEHLPAGYIKFCKEVLKKEP